MPRGAYEEAVKPLSFEAVADHSGDNPGLNLFVVLSEDVDDAFEIAGEGDDAAVIGVLTNKPPEGSAGRIVTHGCVPVLLGGDVDRGDLLAPDADGAAVTGSGTRARATQSGVAGEIITALLL